MTRKLLAMGSLCAVLALAQTQVDLTHQVRNPLPYATGGTNASSQIAARASVGTPKLVAADFTGADIGQQTNNAFASFAAGTCGTVTIPRGSYTYSSTIFVPPGCTLEGQGDGVGATQLIYNGPPATVAVALMRSDFAHGDDTNVRNLNIFTDAGTCPNNGMLAWNTAASGSNKWQCFDGTTYTAPVPHLAAILHGQIDPTVTGDSSRNTIENVEINGQNTGQGAFHFGVYLNGCEECVLKTVSVLGADDGFYIGAASNGNLYDQITARFNRRSGIHSRGFNASTFMGPLLESNQWLGHSFTPGYGIGFLCDGENAVGSCDVRVYGAYYEANWLDISAPDVNHPLTGYVGATGTRVNRGNIATNIEGYFEDATLQGCTILDGTKVHVVTSGTYLSYDCFVASGKIDDNNGNGGRLIHTAGGASLSISQASAAMSWSFDPSPGGHTPMTFTDTSPVGAGSYGLMFNVSNNAT
ncbi:MAG TPA: hypothetical protein VEU62_02060, partial [Bryobacterales bacterium]|nr:hypothetical protein [Bryobacterales bacterium]